MKTLFASDAWAPASTHWLGQLGQETTTVVEAERDEILRDLRAAKARGAELAVLESGVKGPLEELLGADHAQYTRIARAIAPFGPTVDAVLERMENPDPEFWLAVSLQEASEIRAWKGGIDQLLAILRAHVAPREPGTVPPAGAARAAAPAAILGVPQTFLVAGGLAVGLGILFFAILKG